MTTATPTQAEQEYERDTLRCSLQDIDRTQSQASLVLNRVFELRRLALELVKEAPLRLAVAKYDLDSPGEPRLADALGLPGSVLASLAGAYLEPLRELIAATDAAEAALNRLDLECEDDRARVERDLLVLR